MILEKAKFYRRYIKNGRSAVVYHSLREITARCKLAINDAKEGYFTRLDHTLSDQNIGPKKYWSTLNQFIHKRKYQRSLLFETTET